MPKHVTCQQEQTFRIVVADDFGLAVIRWCEHCDRALGNEDFDPPQAFNVADVPPETIARLIDAHMQSAKGTIN